MKIANILYIKSAKAKELKKLHSDKTFLSGIKKEPVDSAMIDTSGIVGNEVGDTIHHGGVNKAIMFISTKTYESLNTLAKVDFAYDSTAYYGENIVVDNIDESSVYVGDVLSIGEVKLEVSQPRQPCWKLSSATGVKDMTAIIYKNGLTGWYARVLKGGKIKKGDAIVLEKRAYPNLSIKALNQIIIDPSSDKKLTDEAIECEKLGYQFKDSLRARAKMSDAKNEPFLYHREPI